MYTLDQFFYCWWEVPTVFWTFSLWIFEYLVQYIFGRECCFSLITILSYGFENISALSYGFHKCPSENCYLIMIFLLMILGLSLLCPAIPLKYNYAFYFMFLFSINLGTYDFYLFKKIPTLCIQILYLFHFPYTLFFETQLYIGENFTFGCYWLLDWYKNQGLWKWWWWFWVRSLANGGLCLFVNMNKVSLSITLTN